jgi:hypothetical protein
MQRVVLAMLIVALTACGDVEKAQLKKQISDHEARIAALEERLAKPNAALPGSKSKKPAAASQPVSGLPSSSSAAPASARQPSYSVAAPTGVGRSGNERLAIRAMCSKKWGSNWEMLEYCEKTELEAMEKVNAGNIFGVPPDVYTSIRDSCGEKYWPSFSMQLECQQQESDAYQQQPAQ